MNKRYCDKPDAVTIDLTDLLHPSLRGSAQGVKNREIKPRMLSSGCILYGYDVFTFYRRRGLRV